jgi:DNA-binding transcriptional regulator YbjK
MLTETYTKLLRIFYSTHTRCDETDEVEAVIRDLTMSYPARFKKYTELVLRFKKSVNDPHRKELGKIAYRLRVKQSQSTIFNFRQ